MIPERFLAPFEEGSFQFGLQVGLVALVVAGLVGLAWRRGWGRPAPVAGLALAVAALVALNDAGRFGDGLPIGLVALGVAGLVVDVYLPARPALPVLALPGAWLIAIAVEVSQDWVPVAVGVVIVVGGALVALFDHHDRDTALGPALLVASFAGVFVTVPETAEALPVLGAALPLALFGWPLRLARLGAGGSLAAVGLLVWTVAQGGTFRDSAVVGGLACLGLLVALPAGRALAEHWNRQGRGRRWTLLPAATAVAVAGVHAVVVLVVARVAGLQDDLGTAMVIAFVTLTVAVAAGAAMSLVMPTTSQRP